MAKLIEKCDYVISLRLPKNLYSRLQLMAKLNHISTSMLIRKILEEVSLGYDHKKSNINDKL